PGRRAGGDQLVAGGRLVTGGAVDGDRGGSDRTIDRDVHVGVGEAVVVDRALDRGELDPGRDVGSVAARRVVASSFGDQRVELRGRRDVVDETPLHRLAPLHAFGAG